MAISPQSKSNWMQLRFNMSTVRHREFHMTTNTYRVLLVLFLISGNATADGDVYKVRGPDGRLVYTDVAPSKNAAATRLPPAPETAGVVLVPPHLIEARRQRDNARILEQTREFEALKSAEEKLRKAEKAKQEGEEPRAGERQRLARGGSRLNDRYQQRQEQRESELNDAQNAVDAARRGVRSTQ